MQFFLMIYSTNLQCVFLYSFHFRRSSQSAQFYDKRWSVSAQDMPWWAMKTEVEMEKTMRSNSTIPTNPILSKWKRQGNRLWVKKYMNKTMSKQFFSFFPFILLTVLTVTVKNLTIKELTANNITIKYDNY
jgi:hypothetical protein